MRALALTLGGIELSLLGISLWGCMSAIVGVMRLQDFCMNINEDLRGSIVTFFLSVALWHIIRSWGQGKERCVCSCNAHTKAQVIIILLRESIRERYRDLSGVTDALLKEINLLAFPPFFCMSHRASKSLIRLTFKSVYCNCLLLFYLLSVIWSCPQLIQTSAYLKVFKRIIFPMSAQAMWEYSIWEYV